MAERYIAFDVETPNANNSSISSIGLAVVEGGMVVDSFSTLVDPEVHFDCFNMQLTGITPERVEGAPNFPQLWEQIVPLMDSGLLVAHNAPFDMSVLAKCLNRYQISWHPGVSYACTCRMGRACYPKLPNHRLNTLCGWLGIPLDHHDAASDGRACAELLIDYMDHGLEPERFARWYDLERCRTLPGPRR